MLTNNLMDSGIPDFLYEKDIIIEVIKYLDYGEETQQKYKDNKVLNTASKINIFNLKKYNKLVYIDADCVFIKNCDFLFDYEDGSILYNETKRESYSGLFVICPNNHNEFSMLKNLILNYPCLDGDLFDDLWFFVKNNKNYQIPINIFQEIHSQGKLKQNTKILHCGHNQQLWNWEYQKDIPLYSIYQSFVIDN